MTYNNSIHFDIPDEESKPVVKYVDNNYKFLDFYECSDPYYSRSRYADANAIQPELQIDSLIDGSTISENGTFTKNMQSTGLRALRVLKQLSKESGGITLGYDVISPKSTTFAKTHWTVDLLTGFHNDLQISGFLGASTKTRFTTLVDKQNITVQGLNLRKEFFNYRLGILKAYNPLIRELQRLDGYNNWASYDTGHFSSQVINMLKDQKYQNPVYKLLSREDTPEQKFQLREFGQQNDTTDDRNMIVDFKGLDNKAARCTLVLNDGSTEDGLIEDFYVAVHPTKSKMMSIQTFIEKYGIFADLTKPLVTTRPDPASISGHPYAYENRPGVIIEYHTSDTEHNLTYAQSAGKRGPFLGLSSSLTDKKNLHITVPDSSAGLYQREVHLDSNSYIGRSPHSPAWRARESIETAVYRHRNTNSLGRQPSNRGHGLFDFLRHAIYASGNYYDHGIQTQTGTGSVTSTTRLRPHGLGFDSLHNIYQEQLQAFGFLNPAIVAEQRERSPSTYDSIYLADRGRYYNRSYLSKQLPYTYWLLQANENLYNHTPSPRDSIFVHLYDLEVTLYAKTILTNNPSVKSTDIKEIRYQTTDQQLEADITHKNGKTSDLAVFSWPLSSYKDSTTKNFYMYNVEEGLTYSSIASPFDSLLFSEDGKKFRRITHSNENQTRHKDIKGERNANPAFSQTPQTLQLKPIESGQTFSQINQLVETSEKIVDGVNGSLPPIVFPSADSTVEAIAISPPEPAPINISHVVDLQNKKIVLTWDNGLSGLSEEYSAVSLDGTDSSNTKYLLSINSFTLTINKFNPTTNKFVNQYTVKLPKENNQRDISISTDIKDVLKGGRKGNIDYEIIIVAEYADTFRGKIVADPVKTTVDVDPSIIDILPQLKPVKPELSIRRTGTDFVSLGFVNNVPEGTFRNYIQTIKSIEVEYYASNDKFNKTKTTIPLGRSVSSGEFRIDDLTNSTNFTFSIKTTNDYGTSESSNTIVGTTKEPTGISRIKITKESVLTSKITINVEQTNKSNNTRDLTGINFTYLRSGEDVVFPVNTGSVKLASFVPIQRLIDGSLSENVVFYVTEGVYSIFAEPVFGTAVGHKVSVRNINLKRTIISLPPIALPVDRGNATDLHKVSRKIQTHSDVPFYDTNSSLSDNKSLRLLNDSTTNPIPFSNVNDISPAFRPSHIDFLFRYRRLNNTLNLSYAVSRHMKWSATDNRDIKAKQKLYDSNAKAIKEGESHYHLNNLKPSFRFAIQKSVSGQGCHLVGLFGPNPFSLYDLDLPTGYKSYIFRNNPFPTGEWRGTQGSLYPSSSPASWEDTALFYYRLALPADSFTNFYYYDEPNDTLYLQVAQGQTTRYVSIKNMLKGFKNSETPSINSYKLHPGDDYGAATRSSQVEYNFVATPTNPYVIEFPASSILEKSTGSNSQKYSSGSHGRGDKLQVLLGNEANRSPNDSSTYRNILKTVLPDNFVIKDNAIVPDVLRSQLSGDPKNNIPRFQETHPDNGVYIKTSNTNSNFYRVSTNAEQINTRTILSDYENNPIPYPSSAISPQSWEAINFPVSVDVLYEDSGFYLTKGALPTARTPTGIIIPAPVILRSSKNDGVGTYQGFSTINIIAQFKGSLNLEIYQFRGYVVEKYVDDSWVQIETSSVYTEYDPQDRFQSDFSFKIFLADGVAKYRMAVKVRGVTDDVEIIGSYVELEKLSQNLITEDFN